MISKTYEIEAPVEKVWDALTNKESIMQWTGADAEMAASEDFDFNMWDGDVWGRNIRVVKNELLEQSWYGGDWPKPSHVVIQLDGKHGKTTVQLTHTDVPGDVEADFDAGWDTEYFGPIEQFVRSE